MAQKRHTAEQIMRKLREVEVAQDKGKTIPQAIKHIGVTEPDFLALEQGIRRYAGGPGEAAQGAGEGKPQAEATWWERAIGP